MKPIAFAVVLAWLGALHIIWPPAALMAQQSVTLVLYGGCNTATFTSNDSFSQNLAAVVKSLTQNASRFMYTLAASETGSQSNYVYGVYQCRGDISLSDCTTCVNSLTSFQNPSNPCGRLVRGLRRQYFGCFFRYENYKFYTGVEKDGIWNPPPQCAGASNESSRLYKQNVVAALEDSAAAAPRALYGFNATSVGSGSNSAYALTQCYGYLNFSECAACLSQVSNNSNGCNESVSGDVFFNSCYYLYGNSPLVFTDNNTSPSINSSNGAPPLQAPYPAIASSSTGKGKNHTGGAVVGIVVGACALLAIIISAAVYFLKHRKESAKSPTEIHEAEGDEIFQKPGATSFSLKELEDATDNFHPDNKLGEGGFGPVYQGRLKSGMEVAIKMLSTQSHQGKKEFINEIGFNQGHSTRIEIPS